MKIPQLASLTATAALLLQCGCFVQANPMFVEIPPAESHGNDASGASCDDVRILYPAGEGIVFDNNTNHVVAWDVPSAVTQVNLTLVGQDYVSHLKTLPAQQRAYDVSFVLKNGAQPGEYRVQLATIGGNTAPCQVDSTSFQIEASTEPAPVQQEEQTKGGEQKHDNKDWDAMLSQLGQYVDKDNDDDDDSKEKSKSSSSSHSNAASEDQRTQSFDAYIKSLDMDYLPYINNNKDTESDVVTHKNSVEDDTPAAAPSANDKYFTNEDHRTHVDAHLNEELSQLTGGSGDNEHADSPFFQGSGGAQTVNKVSSTSPDDGEWVTDEMPAPVNQWVDESSDAKDHPNGGAWNEELSQVTGEHPDSPFFQGSGGAQTVNQGLTTSADDGEWVVDEMPAPVNQWVDESSNVKDHSNEGAWIEEEYDPSTFTATHPNEGWTEVTSDNDHAPSDFDHSNIGTWIAQEIEDTPEPKTTYHVDDVSPQGWIAEEDAHSNESVDIPDHSNVGQWQAEEIDSDHDNLAWQYSHANKAENENGWVESESTHPNVVTDGWQEETTAHPDAVVDGWQEESSSHPNVAVVNGWQEDTSAHPDAVVDGWQDESSTAHPNVAAGGWQEEQSTASSSAAHMDDNVLIYSAEELIN